MARRTRADWLKLFEEQKSSGLNYTNFAISKDISPKYFSFKRSQLKSTTQQVSNKKDNFVATKILLPIGFICIEHKQTSIKLPASISVNWLVQFVQQLG